MYRSMVSRGKPGSRVATRAADSASARIMHAVRVELARGTPVVVAVSGGRDSMVLLEAVARVRPDSVAAVATFDHGTGPAATHAASLVRERAKTLGLPVRQDVSRQAATTEAGWRAQRMAFLEQVASELGARVITAHTLDDHLETVLMRALRGAGARGLAGLFAPSKVGRPFVGLARSTIALCAARVVRDVRRGSHQRIAPASPESRSHGSPPGAGPGASRADSRADRRVTPRRRSACRSRARDRFPHCDRDGWRHTRHRPRRPRSIQRAVARVAVARTRCAARGYARSPWNGTARIVYYSWDARWPNPAQWRGGGDSAS